MKTALGKKIKRGQEDYRTKMYGAIKEHVKVCERCNNEYTITCRKNTNKYRQSKYCSMVCAKSRTGWWKENAKTYRTIAFQNHQKKCVICSEELIVEVHHLDENKENNSPENLIPMCPTHHQYWHSAHRHLVEQQVLMYISGWQKNNSV